MTKLRVYELARELNVETKVLLSKLKGGARNLSHQSTLTDQQISELREAFAAPVAPSGQDASKRKVVIRRRVATVGEEAVQALQSSSAIGSQEEQNQEADVPRADSYEENERLSSRAEVEVTPAPQAAQVDLSEKKIRDSADQGALETGPVGREMGGEIQPSKTLEDALPIAERKASVSTQATIESGTPLASTQDAGGLRSAPESVQTEVEPAMAGLGGVSERLPPSSAAGVSGASSSASGGASSVPPRRSTSQSATVIRPAQTSSSATVVRSASPQRPQSQGLPPRAEASMGSPSRHTAAEASKNYPIATAPVGSELGARSTTSGPTGGIGVSSPAGGSAGVGPGASVKPAGTVGGAAGVTPPPMGSTAGLTPGAGIAAPIPPNRSVAGGGAPQRPVQNTPLRQNVPLPKSPGGDHYGPTGVGSGGTGAARPSGPSPHARPGATTGSYRGDGGATRRDEGGRDFRSPPSRGAVPVPSQVPVSQATGQQVAPSGAVGPKRRDMGGATIVRKATPEEVENLQSQAAKRQQTGRKEDHRGTRVTGLGLLQNRISGDAPGVLTPDPNQIPPPFEEAEGWSSRKANPQNKERKMTDEEEIAKKRAIKKAKGQSNLNMRALLEQVDELDRPEEEAVAQARTVYLPTAPRSKRELKRRKDLKKTQITAPRAAYRVIEMGENITVHELAKNMSVKSAELIKKLMAQGVMATLNQTIDADVATLLAAEFGFEVKSVVETVDDIIKTAPVDEATLESRPPIVTVMGHVDHGKTSILDVIRSANVASGEAGGITQHIGAYSVEHHGKRITFLDTPGHEAFSAMRSRGAKLTDIVVLVVAADDGVMPQTIEAISHAKAAKVPMIVAINKIDKPNVNFDRIYTELSEHGVQAEEWGGDVQFVKCSALQKRGIEDLLEGILLLAEVSDLKSTRKGHAQGVVIEAHLDKGRGPVATVVIERGVLRIGDMIVAGNEYGRIRAMHDHLARDVVAANPSDPVEIIGLSGVPMAGDSFHVVTDEKTAREAADWRVQQLRRQAAAKSSAASLEDLLNKVKTEDVYEVPIILKADTQGSLEAISETILKLSTPKVKNKIIHAAVGGVTESDITLGLASGALVVAFNVRAMRGMDDFAEHSGVPIKYFSIIYEIVDAVKAIMVGKLPPIINEVILGHAEVRKPINVPKIGTIAGSAVLDGKITRTAQCRLIRDSVVIYTGKLGSLRRFKDDVKEVAQGFECGIGIDGYNDLREGDVIEAFAFEETTATL